MKKFVKVKQPFCDNCGKSVYLTNHRCVRIGKKEYDFCYYKCQEIFGYKKRWKGYVTCKCTKPYWLSHHSLKACGRCNKPLRREFKTQTP